MREEVISSGGTIDPTPASSSAGASSPAVQTNIGSAEGSILGPKGASLSCVGSQPQRTSLSIGAGGSAFGTSRPSCKPWERGDLLRRLATFKPGHWFEKPKVVNPLACVQRGWISVDIDRIECESCGAHLSFVLLPSWTSAKVQNAVEVFAKKLDSGHAVSCSWKGNSCPESLVQFLPTSPSALIGGYKDRCDALLQFPLLPTISASAIKQMCSSRSAMVDRLLAHSHYVTMGEVDNKPEGIQEVEGSPDGTFYLYSRAQKLISLCGWEPRWLCNVQDCEENSAQSTRNGCSFGPTQAHLNLSQDAAPTKKFFSASTKNTGEGKLVMNESRSEFRSPVLDCSACGATARITDFLTVYRPTRFTTNNIDIPVMTKKMGLTRGASAASGISGWVANDDVDKEPPEDRDEVATTDERRLLQNEDVDLNLTMAGSLSFSQLGRTAASNNVHDGDMGMDLMIGQPSGSEVGDRAASYESRGPSYRKRSLEKGGSSDNRAQLMMQQADSVEGTVIDRDVDEVTESGQNTDGPSKRARDSEIFDTYCSSYHRTSDVAGPSHSIEIYADGNRFPTYQLGSDHVLGIHSARDSTRASSVIAMDTVCHGADHDSMESVENYPGDVDDIHFPSSSTYGNIDINDASELNNSIQAQQSICFQLAAEVVPGDMGVSSTNDGEEIFNAETATAQVRDGFSFGISGGSVGMCASHEAEIHGADVSVHRADSVVGEVEPRVEDGENQGQTGESAPDPGLMDEIVPDEINREDRQGDSQEMLSRSIERADSGSKIDGSAQADSVESGEKISQSCKLILQNSRQNTYLYYHKNGKKEETNTGPPKEESTYELAAEFDPIIHHNSFCPWVNGNVAAAACMESGSRSSFDGIALCGWQLTLDALDALQQGQNAVPTLQSESATSLYKDDHCAHGKKQLRQ